MNYKTFKSKPWILAKHLAGLASEALPTGTSAHDVALKSRNSIGVNYMRCREFQGVSEELQLRDGMEILDISSPQWYTLCLAYLFPNVKFCYTNIIQSEIDDYEKIAEALNLKNLHYKILDIREPEGSDCYDLIYSISVIEHVYPEVGGDVIAYKNIKKLLGSSGRFIVTVPYKENYNAIYSEGQVYERDGAELKFFAREYDKESYAKLEQDSGLISKSKKYIVEKKGFFALDYYEWGKGKDTTMAKLVLFSTKVCRRLFGAKFDAWVANSYYSIEEAERYRVVNIVAAYELD